MENSVINDDAAGESLRQMAMEADAGKLPDPSGHEQVEPPPGDDSTAAKPGDNTDDMANGQKEPADGADKPDAGKQDKQVPAKEPSAYEKAKEKQRKEEERLARNRREFEEEKANWRRDRGQEEQHQTTQRQLGPVKDSRGYTAADYDKVAKDFEDDGNPEMAEQARQTAAALRQKESTTQHEATAQQVQRAMQSDLEAVIKADPEYGQKDSSKSKEMAALLGEHPYIQQIPNGFSRAAEILQMRRTAAQVPELTARAEKAEKEVERLTKLTQISGGGPAAPAGQKTFEQMSDREQRDFLHREAERADGMG